MKPEDLMIGLKYIPNYEGLYSIDINGNVYSHITGKFLKANANHGGYLMVDLYKNGKVKKKVIHRLVAETFIPNPDNLPEVDHLDTNRRNNNANNLKWCTRKENCNNPLTLKHSGDGRRGEKHYLYGKKLSEVTRKKMSESRKGHHVSEETRRKIGYANRGHIMSDEQKLAISKAHKGKMMGCGNSFARKVRQYTKEMIFLKEWSCISYAKRELGISVSSICNNLKGLSKTAGGFIWKS